MDIYKKNEKGRKKQINYLYDNISRINNKIRTYEVLIYLNDNWKPMFPIADIQEAFKICNYINALMILNSDDFTNDFKLKDYIKIYTNLNYLEYFMDRSPLKNTILENQYELLLEYFADIEFRNDYLEIK